MPRYRKKPVEVEAWQVGTEPKPDWVVAAKPIADGVAWNIATTIMPCVVNEGDYLILHADDTLTYCPECTFRATYEVIE